MRLMPQFAMDMMLPWSSQVGQYEPDGAPGLSYFLGEMPEGVPPVDCLLWRDGSGALAGVLTYFAVSYYEKDGTLLDEAGNFTVLVRSDARRQGIATKLVAEADRRWKLDELRNK